jgi:hypothetical protein
MRLGTSLCCVLVGSLLVLAAAGPLAAAAPPAAVFDSRQAWLFNRGMFRPDGIGRWLEEGPAGKRHYREHRRTKDYLELYEPARRRFIRLYPWGQYVYVPARKHYAWVGRGRWAHPANRPLDFGRNAGERGKLMAPDQRNGFPRLGEEFEVLAPASVTYNCIGWSVGNNSTWVWPTDSTRKAQLVDFDTLYRSYGFYRARGISFKRRPGYEKILLYAIRREDGSIKPTHAARQMPDGSWSSKLGSLPLIRHLHPNDVSGPTYGQPFAIYIRRSPGSL